MMYGLKYKNIHSYTTHGLIMLSKNRTLLPATSDEYADIPGRDGSILFPGSMKDRNLEVEFSTSTKTLPELRQLARQIAAWLYSTRTAALIFDDEPDLYYMAKVANQLDLEQTVAMGRFSVQFRCEPLAYSIAADTWEQAATAGATYTINNGGTYEALPVITITAGTQITGFVLTVEDKTLTYTGTLTAGQSLIIDCSKYQATKAGVNAMGDVSGDFPVLYTGENELTINKACSLKIDYRKRWL